MKTILLIADHSPEAANAAAFALMVAQAVQADLLIADTVKVRRINRNELVTAGQLGEEEEKTHFTQLREKIDPAGSYIPEITQIDISDLTDIDLITLINRKEIWLLVKGMPNVPAISADLKPNMQSVLNRIRCPLLLIPQSWQVKNLERLVYMADLRYCRQFVLKFLGILAAGFDAGVSIAHLSAKELPHIVDPYAAEIFRTTVMPHAHYKNITLSNTRERDLHKATDVLINGMHNDLMVIVNHRFHFEQLIGRQISEALPAELTIPVLIFPL